MGEKKKIAVVLFNLGGPDCTESIRPFLLNFFMDKNIIRLPFFLRWILANFISRRRSKNEAGSSYAMLGGKSPLLENTKKQAGALEKELGEEFKVFTCMRYWHPMAEQVVQEVKDYDPDQIILLPLYPQFSTTTTHSSFENWNQFAADLNIPTSEICCYPLDSGFIKASAKNIRQAYEQALEETSSKDLPLPRILFSAHGLPEDVIKGGDPYQWQCEQTAAAIIKEMDIPMLDWVMCYQSRVGPKKWIGPATSEVVMTAGADNVPLLIYPHAFVNEHVETLVEIEIEYKELAQQSGVPYFARVPTVSTAPAFIKGLATMVKNRINHSCDRQCPAEFDRCYFGPAGIL